MSVATRARREEGVAHRRDANPGSGSASRRDGSRATKLEQRALRWHERSRWALRWHEPSQPICPPLPAALRERGAATIWVLTCSTIVLLLALVVAIRASAILARHRAERAADLAALAAAGRIGYVSDAAEICSAAGAIAAANGGRLLSCTPSLRPDGLSGAVTVRAAVLAALPVVGRVQATASARAARLPAGSMSRARIEIPFMRAPPSPDS
jgi:secretion/DNA translocation related TadE-like protein